MSQEVERPIEVELKYRVDGPGGGGTVPGRRGRSARSRRIGRARVTVRGSLRRYGRRCDGASRIRRPDSPERARAPSFRSRHSRGPRARADRCDARSSRDRPTEPPGRIEWPASDARSLVLELAGDAPLVEVVTIRQLRRKRIVRDGDTRVELSLDEVDVVARSRVVDRFVELEAELVKGSEERLGPSAEVFDRGSGTDASSTGSKLEAALAV